MRSKFYKIMKNASQWDLLQLVCRSVFRNPCFNQRSPRSSSFWRRGCANRWQSMQTEAERQGARHAPVLPWTCQWRCSLVTWEIIPSELLQKVALCSHIRIISDNRDPPIATQLAPKETFCNKIFIRPKLSHTPQSIWTIMETTENYHWQGNRKGNR